MGETFGVTLRNPTGGFFVGTQGAATVLINDDPPDADCDGYDFRLAKLNQFDGDFVQAEMVRAFISSIEYRRASGNSSRQ